MTIPLLVPDVPQSRLNFMLFKIESTSAVVIAQSAQLDEHMTMDPDGGRRKQRLCWRLSEQNNSDGGEKNIFHAVADALPPPDQHQPPLSSSFPEGNAAITPAGPEPVSNAIIITNGGDALLSSLFVALRGW